MITVEEATNLIKLYMPSFGESEIHLQGLEDNVTTEDLIADRDYPPFNRVMMDGIAVSWNTFKEGKRDYRVAGICAAGIPQKELTDLSSCFEVMTGAPLPAGADLVIPYEHLEIIDGVARVTREQERPRMENVHLQGSDAKKGDVLLKQGQMLNGPHWGIATSIGYGVIKVNRKPRINIISTGDELVPVMDEPLDHQIRRSNAYALKASLLAHGFSEVKLSHLPDEVSAIETHFEENKHKFDVLIYSGGVSKGKFDYLPSTWKKLGVTEYFHGISQRPGKPLWFGVDQQSKTVVFGLPGNPVSSLVCLHRYFLDKREIYAELGEEIVFKNDLTFFVPVTIEYTRSGKMIAHPLKIKNSGEFSALAGSDGFIELPKDQAVFKSGEAFRFHSWRNL